MLFDHFFSSIESDHYLHALTAASEIQWRQERIKLYGKVHKLPRLTAWYGEPGARYSYSGICSVAMPWTKSLLAIKHRIEQSTAGTYNGVLLNLYRDGADGMGWHSDDEPELGPAPVIASVSFGQPRNFQMKHKVDAALRQSILLGHGSLLLMQGETQKNWLHQVPKRTSRKSPMGVRVNLTFRQIM